MTIPLARIVRDRLGRARGARSPWLRRRLLPALAPARERARIVLATAIGLMPLVATAALALGLAWSAGFRGAP